MTETNPEDIIVDISEFEPAIDKLTDEAVRINEETEATTRAVESIVGNIKVNLDKAEQTINAGVSELGGTDNRTEDELDTLILQEVADLSQEDADNDSENEAE